MTRIFNTQDNIDLIINLCCEKAKITRDVFMMKNRQGDVILARQVAIKILIDCVGMTYVAVGYAIGRRKYDHSTMIHHHRRVNELISVEDDRVMNLYNEVINELKDAVKVPNKIMVYIADDEATIHRVTDFFKKEKKLYYEIQ
jgi:chromosomal replication initiation ATPase DnaA